MDRQPGIPNFNKSFIVKIVGEHAARNIYDSPTGTLIGDIGREDLIRAIEAYIKELEEFERNAPDFVIRGRVRRS